MIAKGCAAEMSRNNTCEVYHLNKSGRCKQDEVVFYYSRREFS